MRGSIGETRQREHEWLGLAMVACCIACGHEASGGNDTSGTGGSPACQVACDAGMTMHDAGSHDSGNDSGPPPPMGHPAPANSTGCAPVGPDAAALGATRDVLYSGPRVLGQLSVRSQGIFVVDMNGGLLWKMADTKNFVPIVPDAKVSTFVAADLNLYWISDGMIRKVSIVDMGDFVSSAVASGVRSGASLLTYDETNLYFADSESIWKQPLDGSAATMLHSAIAVQDMKVFGGSVYYSDLYSQRVYRVPADGGDAKSLAVGMQGSVQAVAADTDAVYWVDDTQIERTALDSPGTFMTIGQGGSAPLGRGRVMTMKLADDRLYWVDDVFNVGWTAIDGSACGLVVTGLAGVDGWDVDEHWVYVTVPGGGGASELWRIERYSESQ